MANLEDALQRAARESDFRGRLFVDERGVQAEYGLSDADMEQLRQAVVQTERHLVADPLEATEVDHGAEEGAGPNP